MESRTGDVSRGYLANDQAADHARMGAPKFRIQKPAAHPRRLRVEPGQTGKTACETTASASQRPAGCKLEIKLAGIDQRWLEGGAGDGNRTHGEGAAGPFKTSGLLR